MAAMTAISGLTQPISPANTAPPAAHASPQQAVSDFEAGHLTAATTAFRTLANGRLCLIKN
jgi:hypothetical protein